MVLAAGIDIHCRELVPAEPESGPPLVLLHGLGDSHLSWSMVAGALARRRRVLVPDLPGHGLSGRPDASYALAWHAEVMGDWLDAMRLDTVDLVGHSYGGGVAQWMLLGHRERVRRLALVAPGGLGRAVGVPLRLASLGVVERLGQPFMGVGTRIGLRLAGAGYTAEEIARIAWMSAQPGTARALSRTVADVIDLRGQRRHFLDRAHEVDPLPPIVVMWGDRDRVLPFAQARDALGLIDAAALSRYRDCGHFPHRQCAARFAGELDEFLTAADLPVPRLRVALQVQVPGGARSSALRRASRVFLRGLRRLFGRRGIMRDDEHRADPERQVLASGTRAR